MDRYRAMVTMRPARTGSKNRLAVAMTYIALGCAGVVVAATGWGDPGWALSIGLLCAIALLFWQSAAFGPGEERRTSGRARREEVIVTTAMLLWIGALFVWVYATERHLQADALVVAADGMTFVAWGCWRLRGAVRQPGLTP